MMRRVFRIPFTRPRLGRELDDELAFHIETRVARLVAGGMPPDEARTTATRQFGDMERVRRDCLTLDQEREQNMRRANLFDEIRQDVVFALRSFRRNPAFTALVVGALAAGIGANTAIFTLIDSVVLRSLPVEHPEQLVVIGNPSRVGGFSVGSPRVDMLSYPLYRDLRDHNHSFSDVLATGKTDRLDVRVDPRATDLEHPRGRFVSANYFAVLGVRAQTGQTFDPRIDAAPGSGAVVVISDGYWERRFQRDANVVGRRIVIDDMPMTIIGVAPREFTGDVVGQSSDLWIPASMHDVLRPNAKIIPDRASSWLLAIGRLKPGATLAQATTDVPAALEQSILANAGSPSGVASFKASKPNYWVTEGSRGLSGVRATFTTPLYTLLVGVGLLLCIICANVANLLLARAIARGREMAVRLSLGAHGSRLVRQLLTESALLAVASAGAGLLLAFWGSRSLIAIAGEGGPLSLTTTLDGRVLAFTLAVSLVAVGLFGAVPALRATRVDIASAMRGSAGSISGGLDKRGGKAPLGMLLVIGQVALSIVLLVGAAMLVKSLRTVQGTNTGLDRDHLLIADVDVQTRGYQGPRLTNLVHELRDRIQNVPGVTAVSFSENGLFSGNDSRTSFELPGFQMRSRQDSLINYDVVGPGFVSTLGGRITAGRELTTADEAGLPREGVINQAAASFLFPGESPLGKYLRFSDTIAVRIVGVAADVRDQSLRNEPARRLYLSYVHADDPANFGSPQALNLVVKTSGDPALALSGVRRAIQSVDPALPIDGLAPLATLMQQSIREERMVAKLATIFGVLALLLAAIGLYGVMTYAVSRRTGEIGLRVALGAQSADVIGMVLRQGLTMVSVGLVFGLPLAIMGMKVLRSKNSTIEAVDLAAVGVAVVVLAASAVVAVLVPARRASRVAPGIALKAE